MPRDSKKWIAAYRRSSDWRARIQLLQNALFEGFWLGMLDDRELDEIDEYFFANVRERFGDRVGSYTDADYNLSGLQEWEAVTIDAYFAPGSRVVVTGAGGGREVIALAKLGFDAVGYEPNRSLVDAGSELLESIGLKGRLLPMPRDGFPPDAGACAGIVVGWGSYMHIRGSRRRVAFLRTARSFLSPGDPILISYHVRPQEARRFELSTKLANLIRSARGTERVEVGDGLAASYMHLFSRDEIELELAAGGFRLLRFATEPYGHAVAAAS